MADFFDPFPRTDHHSEITRLKDKCANRKHELTRLKDELGREQQRVRDLQRVIEMRDREIARLKSGPEK